MKGSTIHNSTFAIGGVSCSADSFVVAESFVLRLNSSGKNPVHRKSAKRYAQTLEFVISINLVNLIKRDLWKDTL